MTTEIWLTFAILLAAIVLFVTEWIRLDITALGVVAALMLTGILTPEEAVAGFANPAVITIAALFVVGGAVLQTGLASLIGQRILQVAGGSLARLTGVIMGAVGGLSGFMSSTGAVAVLLPAIVSLAGSVGVSASKLLIPLAYGSLLGGASTLIGTPPNLIVNDLLLNSGLPGLGFFSFTPVGLILLVSGILFVLLTGKFFLPERRPKQEVQRVETAEELVQIYQLPENLWRLRVRRTSSLVGETMESARLGAEYNVIVLDVQRPKEARAIARLGETQLVLQTNGYESLGKMADIEFHPGDILLAKGDAGDVGHAAATWNLGVQPAQPENDLGLISREAGVAEVLLPPRSELIGKTVVEARFGRLYKLTVLGIQRPGEEKSLDIKTTRLQFGDTLLVQGAWENILALRNQRHDFVVMGEPEAMRGAPTAQKAPLALLILLGMLALMISGAVPLVTASLLAALALVLTGCLTVEETYASIDGKSIVLIAGMLPMATALEKVGLVNLAAQALIQILGNAGPSLVLAVLFLTTAVFTQVLSNTATTVLIAPIALATAQKLGVQPQALLMGVAIAASMAFASPVASPVNTLVMGAGDYRFSDYLKIGVPLILLTLAITVLTLPLFFPFQ